MAKRMRRPYERPDDEDKDLLSFLILYRLLDKKFKTEDFASEKDAVYNRLMGRMSMDDIAQLADAVSSYRTERGTDDDGALASFALRRLAESGFLRSGELKHFRR